MSEESFETTSNSASVEESLEQANDLVTGLWTGQLLRAAVKVGILENLSDEPTTVETLADKLELDADKSYRLLRALGHHGVVTEVEEGHFVLTHVGEFFQEDHPHSQQQELLFFHSPEWVSPMFHLADIVKEGDPNGFVREFGCDLFEYTETNSAFGNVFNNFMTAASRDQTSAVLSALEEYDFTSFSHVCDVGGGHGHLLCHLLEAYPSLEGTVLDLPSVVAEEQQRLAPKLGVEERCTYAGGDMFDEVPSADAYFLKWILHDWSDEECVRILSNIHEAAPSDGRVFIIELVVPGPGTPHFGKHLDMTMMVHLGGRERTKAEYSTLLEKADWKLVEKWDPDQHPMSVLEAEKF